MKITIKKCHWCGKLGVGPHRVRLWPFEDRMACSDHFKEALAWHESRQAVIHGIKAEKNLLDAVGTRRYWIAPKRQPKKNWLPYITECADMAVIAMNHDDRRGFVYYFSHAMLAWTAKEYM